MDPITLLLVLGGGFLVWRNMRDERQEVPPGYVVAPPSPPVAPPPPAPVPVPVAPSTKPKPKPVPVRPAPTQTAPKIKDTQRLDAAAVLARMVAVDIGNKGMGYDRALLSKFQKVANIGVDGKYGAESAGAVEWYVRGFQVNGKPLKAPPPFPQWGKGYKTYYPGF